MYTESKIKLFTVTASGEVISEAAEFKPISQGGREKAVAFELYNIENLDGSQGPRAALMNYLPGACAPTHTHSSWELIYIIDGTLTWGEHTFPPGSLIRLEPESSHSPSAPNGCLGIVIWEGPISVSGK